MGRSLGIITACVANVSSGLVANPTGIVMTDIEVMGEDYVACVDLDVEIDVLTHVTTAAASVTDKTATTEAWAMVYEHLAIVTALIAIYKTVIVSMDTVDVVPEMMTGAARQAGLGCVDCAMTIWGTELMAVAAVVMGQSTLVLDFVDFVVVAVVAAAIEVLETLAVTKTVTVTATEMAVTTSSTETAVIAADVVVTEVMPAGTVIVLAHVGTGGNTGIGIRVRCRMMPGKDGEAMTTHCRRMETVLTMTWHTALSKGAIKLAIREGGTTLLRVHPTQSTNT